MIGKLRWFHKGTNLDFNSVAVAAVFSSIVLVVVLGVVRSRYRLRDSDTTTGHD